MNQTRFHYYCCHFYENGQLVEGPRLLAVKEVLAMVMGRDFLKKELLVLNDTERNITYPHLHIDTGIDDSYLLLLINRKVVTKSINMFESVSDLVYPYLYMGIVTRTQAPIVMIEDYPGSPQAPTDVTKVLTSTFSERLTSFGYTLVFASYQPTEIEMAQLGAIADKINDPLPPPRTMGQRLGDDWQRRALSPLLKPKAHPKEAKSLRQAVANPQVADAVIDLINKLMEGKTDPRDLMMPVTAAVAAKQLREPTWTELHNDYPDLKLSETSFYRLRKPDNSCYRDSEAFRYMISLFEAL